MELTIEQLKEKLTNDPAFLAQVIVENNLAAVSDNIISLGLSPSPVDAKAALFIINDLIQSGRTEDYKRVLAVKWKWAVLPEGYDQAIQELTGASPMESRSFAALAGSILGPLLQNTTISFGGKQTPPPPPPPPAKDNTTLYVILGVLAAIILIVIAIIAFKK
jgi:hypothetical protein